MEEDALPSVEFAQRVDSSRVCSLCGKRGFKEGGLAHHLRNRHRGDAGMLQALLPLLPPRQAARAMALGDRPRIAYEDDWLAVVVTLGCTYECIFAFHGFYSHGLESYPCLLAGN